MIFAMSICLASAMICGLVPAWLAARVEPWASLQEGARDSEHRSRRRARHALVVAQLGLAMVLLVGAGLMIRSVLALRALDLGFRPERVLAIDVAADAEVEESGTSEPIPRGLPAGHRTWVEFVRREEARAKPYRLAFDGILERVRALPQVLAAGGSSQLPLIDGPIGTDASVLLEGQAPGMDGDWRKNPFVNQMSATEGYFEAMGTRLVAGRLFTARDRVRRGARGDHRRDGRAPVLSGPRGGRPQVECRGRAERRARHVALADGRRRRGGRPLEGTPGCAAGRVHAASTGDTA